jgi:hypothetical protein
MDKYVRLQNQSQDDWKISSCFHQSDFSVQSIFPSIRSYIPPFCMSILACVHCIFNSVFRSVSSEILITDILI